MKKIWEFVRAIVWAAAVWLALVAILFVNYNWDVFTQFVKDFSWETAIVLLVPTLLAGVVLRDQLPEKKKS